MSRSIKPEETDTMPQQQKEKLIYLRQWIGFMVTVNTTGKDRYRGHLTNIVFDGGRLMYIMLDEEICLNYDHVVEIRVER